MQKIETQNSNPENTNKPTRKKKNPEHQPKKHKPTTKNIPSETDQPRRHRKRIKRQTKPKNTKNGPLVLRPTNLSRFGAEIIKPMALRC